MTDHAVPEPPVAMRENSSVANSEGVCMRDLPAPGFSSLWDQHYSCVRSDTCEDEYKKQPHDATKKRCGCMYRKYFVIFFVPPKTETFSVPGDKGVKQLFQVAKATGWYRADLKLQHRNTQTHTSCTTERRGRAWCLHKATRSSIRWLGFKLLVGLSVFSPREQQRAAQPQTALSLRSTNTNHHMVFM